MSCLGDVYITCVGKYVNIQMMGFVASVKSFHNLSCDF